MVPATGRLPSGREAAAADGGVPLRLASHVPPLGGAGVDAGPDRPGCLALVVRTPAGTGKVERPRGRPRTERIALLIT
ncbi:MAG: hypothetical protein AVDCRST_MAG57-2728 [uncultured Blastococcus sp.]|uniref:Uncharacterized protein n=1 Tax=uncultured Blastococcus sp. TaxID=217144 RepID=A0A6J4IUU1_9ACTN|nr:MAG: hypothetical protein AVDCRST_MAG57-2728 [uncultured Blastococcus sp.]